MRTVKTRIAAPWLALLLAGGMGPVLAGDTPQHVRVQVDGLSCPFCVYGMEKKIKKLDGLEDVEILVDEGTALLTFGEGDALDFDAIQDAIRKGGFTPRAIEATLTGTLTKNEDRLLLQMNGHAQSMLLVSGAALDRLKATVQEGDRVTITGQVRPEQPAGHGQHPYTLAVQDFELATES